MANNSDKDEGSSATLNSDLGTISPYRRAGDECTGTQCLTEEQCVQEPVSTTTFTGKLEIDSYIHLSRKNFEESIKALIKNTDIPDVDKVLSAPAYPKPGILAQFAEKSYTSREVRYDREYEKQLNLPSGWKLLTTASNESLRNGYFGAAFWHPEYHQVVVSHRGTDPTSLGALYTDFKGVVFNEYASQMNSATTFAAIIINVLNKLNKELRVRFQLFFTGHSLGGWLAQITTFTAKYLKKVDITFQKCLSTEEGYHGHASVFDSPGCKETLLQMQMDFQILNNDQTAFLDSLDITSYLSAPNRINTCNSHTGTIYRLFVNLSHMSKLEEVTPLYNIITHSIDSIVEVFDSETGAVLKDEFGNFRAQQVLDWPLSSGLDGGEEYIMFFKWAKSVNNYHPKNDGTTIQNDNYETKRYLDKTHSMSIFTRSEVQFLERYLMLRKLPNFKPENLFALIQDEKAIRIICNALKTFRIENKVFRCGQAQELEKCIPLVKYTLSFFPDIQCNALKALSSFEVMKIIFQMASENHISLLKEVTDLQVDREWETTVTKGLLGTRNEQVCCLTFDTESHCGISLGNMYKAFISLEESSYHIDHLALSLDWILHQEQHMCMATFLQSEQITNLLLMINCEQVSEIKCEIAGKAYFEKLFKILSIKPEIKVYFFATRNDKPIDLIMHAGNKYPVVNYRTVRREGKMLAWDDLEIDSQQNLLGKKVVTFQGQEKTSLSELLNVDAVNNHPGIKFNDLIDPHTLAKLVNNTEWMVGTAVPTFGDNYYIERSFDQSRVLVNEDILRDDSFADVFALYNVDEVDISKFTTVGNGQNKVVQFEDAVKCDNMEFKIVLLQNEAGFEYLCNKVKEHPVHLLIRESDKLVCHKSFGSMQSIIKYRVGSRPSSEVQNESSLIKERCSKVVLIAGKPRMGKSAVLTRISTIIKETLPSLWVAKVNLQDEFQEVVVGDVDFDSLTIDDAVDLLWKLIGPKSHPQDEKLFKSFFRLKSRVVLLFDSMTEICQPHREKAIKLTKVLMNSKSVEQIWVTTNENLKDTLEMELGTLAYSLVPFSEGDQIKFFNDFWKCKLNLGEVDRGRFDILTDTLLQLVPSSVQEPALDLTRVVLHIKMLVEIFASEFKKSSTFESVPDVPDKLNLLELYKTFISKKFNSYFSKINCDGDAEKIQLKKDAKDMLYKSFSVNQEYSALYTLFEESSIYKFFEDSGMLTLFPCTKDAKD